MKILATGGDGGFMKSFKKNATEFEIIALNKKELNVTNFNQILQQIEKHKPNVFLHCGALTKPMDLHVKYPILSIDTNIIGTANVVKACIINNLKLVYISTDYVYPGTTGNYTEEDALLPINEYAWSKLGGECAVKLYKNSLILRVAMTENEFKHAKSPTDSIKSLISHDEAAEIIKKLINEYGIINVGGETKTIYEYALEKNKDVKKCLIKDLPVTFAKNSSLNISKMTNIITKNDTVI